MALEHILAAIRDEAEAEIAAVEAETDAEISRIEAEAERRVAAELSRHRTGRDAAAARAAERVVNHARLDTDRQIHAASEHVYQLVLGRVRNHLEGLRNDAQYSAVFTQLLDECRSVLPSGSVLQIDPRDRARADALLTTDDGVRTEESLRTCGGMKLVTGDGRHVDNTLEARLARADPFARRLTADLVPALGGGR